MKLKNIKEYELGNHCFGEIMTVNGIDFDDIEKNDAIELIVDMVNNHVDGEYILRELFKTCLQNIDGEIVEHRSSKCEQCGDWNDYNKYKVDESGK